MRKICVFVGSRANWGRLKAVCQAITEHEQLELQLILGASFYSADVPYNVDSRIQCLMNSDDHEGMALTTGILLTKVCQELKRLKPDVVLVHGDRYEVLAVAQAAAYMNIPLAHTEGGEVTGCIDDKVRNAITALADIHFPVTITSYERITEMKIYTDFVKGETIKCVGSTALDGIKHIRLMEKKKEGHVLFVYHPETSHYESMDILIEAMAEAGICYVVAISPNTDAGSRKILKKIHSLNFEFKKDLSPEEYCKLMHRASLCIGNSSSFIKEGSFLGVPAIIVGDRQAGREIDCNVVSVPMDTKSIINAINTQYDKDIQCSDYFGDGTASIKIANILAEVEL